MQPIVIAHHLIWTAYGWWLPNDPRGSMSRAVAADVIAALGELHHGRKPVQPMSRDVRAFHDRAARTLKHSQFELDDEATREIARAFATVIEREQYTCYACAIMPDHVHILIRKHKHAAEEMIGRLQDESRQRLRGSGLRPADHPVWTGGPHIDVAGGWHVYLDHPDEVERTIQYIERNPLPLGRPIQRWPFVKLYDRWPLHEGHSANSPYVKRLRAVGRYP